MSPSCHEVVADPGTVPGLPNWRAFAQGGRQIEQTEAVSSVAAA